jgi:hypothetical protein
MSSYVIREGRRIEVEELDVGLTPRKKKRAPFKADWVKLPQYWVEALRQSKCLSTYKLAHVILFEAFKREQVGGEIVLSSTVTGMKRYAKTKAAKELTKLGLIEIGKAGNRAMRVTNIYYSKKNRRKE